MGFERDSIMVELYFGKKVELDGYMDKNVCACACVCVIGWLKFFKYKNKLD